MCQPQLTENTCTDQGLNGDEVDKSNFPLPNLSKQLKKLTEDVYEGRGFAIIRGLDPDAYSLEDFTVVYLGITSHVAERRGKQDQRGSMLSMSSLPKLQYDDKVVVCVIHARLRLMIASACLATTAERRRE